MESPIVKRIVQVLVQSILAPAAVLFLAAGRLDWPAAWLYVVICLAMIALNTVIMASGHKELIAERAQMKSDAKGWDIKIVLILGIDVLAILAVAGLDFRFGWSPVLPLFVPVAAAIVFVAGNLLFTWAMVSNRFFSAVVRIQRDRHHVVQNGGPYRYVRHPGYLGMIVYLLATPLLLGSIWALGPAALAAGIIGVRTALEDRTLQGELEGYDAYATRVRYRLLPGIW